MLCSHICQLPDPGCWFSSTTGDTEVPKLTLLSVLVEAVLRLPAASCATPAGMLAITVPPLCRSRLAHVDAGGRGVSLDLLVDADDGADVVQRDLRVIGPRLLLVERHR